MQTDRASAMASVATAIPDGRVSTVIMVGSDPSGHGTSLIGDTRPRGRR
jgi:hypothetical protein